MKFIVFSFLSIFSFSTQGQKTFVPGYFITNTNDSVICLIKDVDWNNTPRSFEYKSDAAAEIKTGTLENTSEFGIRDLVKYKRFEVNIDRSSDAVNALSSEFAPSFTKERLFLKLVVEGSANLYSYQETNLLRFFYHKQGDMPVQLIYKRFMHSQTELDVNNTFRQQLAASLKCENKDLIENNLSYTSGSLIKYFTEFNKCSNSAFVNYDLKVKREGFGISVRPGINFSSLTLNNGNKKLKYGSKAALRLGIEGEYILPFNKNTWAVTIEAAYQQYDATLNSELNQSALYKTIEIPVSIRHYFIKSSTSKMFINGSVIYDLAIGSSVITTGPDDDDVQFEPDSKIFFALGAGYKFKDRYSAEIRYVLNRSLLTNYFVTNYTSDFNTISIIFGIKVF